MEFIPLTDPATLVGVSQALHPTGSLSQFHREWNSGPEREFIFLFTVRYNHDGSIANRSA